MKREKSKQFLEQENGGGTKNGEGQRMERGQESGGGQEMKRKKFFMPSYCDDGERWLLIKLLCNNCMLVNQ